MTTPTLIAHRGYTLHYPENTLPAIEAAVRAGACAVEFDVQLTADGVPVLLHDVSLQRMAGDARNIHDLTLAQARIFPFREAERFADLFTDVRIATLAEATAFLATTPRTRAFVEIKRSAVRQFGVGRVMDAVLRDIANIHAQCVVISFDAEVLRYTRAHSDLDIGWVFEPWTADALTIMHELQPQFVFTDYTAVPADLTTLPQGVWSWALYEIADPQTAIDFTKRGAHYIETYAIGEMLRDPRLRTGGCFG